MKRFFLCLMLCLCYSVVHGQEWMTIKDKIALQKSFIPQEHAMLLMADNESGVLNPVSSDNYVYYSLDEHTAFGLLEKPKQLISLDLGTVSESRENLTLDLMLVEPSVQSPQVAFGNEEAFAASNLYGVHYRGQIRGEEGTSLAALSVFGESIFAMIYDRFGHIYKISKVPGCGTHALSLESYDGPSAPYCDNQIDEILKEEAKTVPKIEQLDDFSFMKYVDVAIEADYSVFQAFNTPGVLALYNSDNAALAIFREVTAVFNVVALLFENEGVRIRLSFLRVNDNVTGYDNTGTRSNHLNSFKNQSSTGNKGNAIMVLTRHSFGDGTAGVTIGSLCSISPYASADFGISTTLTRFDPYPTPVIPSVEASNITTMAHELGHVFGSPHTHACQWDVSGNGIANEAIDGCDPVEGSCTNPGYPSPKGTIMSYCHKTGRPGVDYSLGFGPLPGQKIRDFVASRTCLNTCYTSSLTITQDVYANNTDSKAATGTITANNEIFANGMASYSSGSKLVFTTGFRARKHSSFKASINDGCNLVPIFLGPEANQSNSLAESLFDDENSGLNLYPNPSKGELNINYSFENGRSYQLNVYNQVGSLVASFLVSKEQDVIDLSSLVNGQYTVTFESDEGLVSKKVILAR
ncbi:MAG: T9SS type A sorting domain-containing protein [Roseivirga sp.]|nr:T9SS type A sorting domain-containing protein [Roseivirga sp.]